GQKWDRTARRRIFPQMQPPKARASRASDQRRVASPLSKSENDGDAAAGACGEGGDQRETREP
ncbi:Os10g0473200, partial [Oryza sativa Japonica Group]